VRQFRGHTDRITDLHMSADARWLLSASLDGTVRAWDVPSSMCLQASSAAYYDYLPQNSCLPTSPSRQFERVAGKRRAPKATPHVAVPGMEDEFSVHASVEALVKRVPPDPCTPPHFMLVLSVIGS
jgi:hypothetical protein